MARYNRKTVRHSLVHDDTPCLAARRDNESIRSQVKIAQLVMITSTCKNNSGDLCHPLLNHGPQRSIPDQNKARTGIRTVNNFLKGCDDFEWTLFG